MTEFEPQTPSERALGAFNPPPPSAEAQPAALQAALAAFKAQQNNSQGTDLPPRPTPKAVAMKPPPQPRESFMQRVKFLGQTALSLVLVGSIGLVGYQTWHSGNTGVDYRSARTDGVVGYNTSNFGSSGQGGGHAGMAAGSDADLGGQIMAMANNAPAAPQEQRRAEATPSVMSNAVPEPVLKQETLQELTRSDDSNSVASPAAKEAAKGKISNYAPEESLNALIGVEKDGALRQDEAEREVLADRKIVGQPVDRLAEKAMPLAAPLPSGNAVAGAMIAPTTPVPTSMIAPPPMQRMLIEGDAPARPGYQDFGRDKFEEIKDNAVLQVAEAPVSTFSLDVDTASYAFMRRSLNEGHLPPKDAVRVEELINYFDYNYPLPETRETPFKPSVTVMPTPWNAKTKLLHIGVKGFDLQADKRPAANLVFLIDTSGSMDEPSKLPLAKNALKMLVDTLQPADHVAIVTYAGSAGTALEPTAASEKAKILNAIDSLGAGGSTAGAEGIRQAYNLAQAHFDKNGINRVLLATDGDFNVGITDPAELQGFIERERSSGIFLSVLGFGTGNYNDALMQKLAQNGNGTAAYIDNLNEARRVLVDEASRTLFPIAKDVKIQIEFNPLQVSEYRLIGYETRALQREDFNNDKVDAGDVGAGASVTAIYEITPKDSAKLVDDLRYAAAPKPAPERGEEKKAANEYAFLKIRYKLPDGDTSKLITTPVTAKDLRGACPPDTKCEAVAPGEDVRFSVAVAAFGQMLRGGKYTGSYSYDDVIALANGAKGKDEFGLRSEFINLVRLAKNVPALPQQP